MIKHKMVWLHCVLACLPSAYANCDKTFAEVRHQPSRTQVFGSVENLTAIPLREDAAFGVHAQNFQIDIATGKTRPLFEALRAVFEHRSPAAQMEISEAIRKRHIIYGNVFTQYTKDGGKKEFAPKVHGIPMLMREREFANLIDSTKPIINAARRLLQMFYGLAWTDQRVARWLLPGLDPKELEELKKLMQDSDYAEPFFFHPSMVEYPFIPVARFDAAIADPDHPQPTFFEFNSGTPSGLSNLDQILNELPYTDPLLHHILQPLMAQDHTFQWLADAIRSNAASWTGVSDGLSVTIGPGPLNGAHPDILNIAWASGMPYVDVEDLYVDSQGYVRLKAESGDDPIVTGIYNRREESYLLASQKNGIPLRNSFFDEQIQLLRQLYPSSNFNDGVGYDVNFNQQGQVTGVNFDDEGEPALQKLISSVRQDQGTSLAEAVLAKKVYISNIGGRVIDDKRIFDLIAKGLASNYPNTAQPPGLGSHVDDYLQSEKDDLFVIKEPNKSGGEGVYLLAQMPDAERQIVKQRVKEHPENFIVQRFAQLTSTISVDNEGKYRPHIVDWGLFVFTGADHVTRASARSLLPRVANTFNVSTNTSQGAGYGVAVVIADPSTHSSPQQPRKSAAVLPASQAESLHQLISNLDTFQPYRLNGIIQSLEHSLPFLGRAYTPFLTQLRSLTNRPSSPSTRQLAGRLRLALERDERLQGWFTDGN